MQTPSWQRTLERWSPFFVMTVAAALLLFDLGGRALWWDEIINVLIDRQSVNGILTSLGALPGSVLYRDVHPPVFHLIQHFWIGLAGSSDFAVRLPNVIFALIALFLLYRLGSTMDGRTTGTLAVFVVGLSPFWLLYARMARYYALTVMLGLCCTLLYLGLLKRPSRTKWAAYFAVNLVMIYTDYLVVTLLACQMIYLVWARPTRSWLATWVGTMVLLGLAYLPWLPIWHAQSALMGSLVLADLAQSLFGIALKFIFPLLSFTVGETIFPWELPAILGYLVFAGLLIVGMIYYLRRPAPADWPGKRLAFVILFTAIPTLGTIALITFITPTISFIGIANRMFFAFPFVALLVAAGLRALERQAVRVGAVVLLAAVWGYAIRNYYAGEHFFNPVYAVPVETAVADVLDQARPGDAVFSDEDTGFGYYFEQQPHDGVVHYYLDGQEGQEVLENIAGSLAAQRPVQHTRLFILVFGRDRTRRDLPTAFTQIIEPAARVTWERGYTPEDETYRLVKQRLLGREDYRFKLFIQLYELPQ